MPQLRTEGLHSSAVYADAWTNDGRLTIANVRGAADRDAVVLNYAEVTAVRDGGADVIVDGQTVQVSARMIVNATGPWIDRIRRLEDPNAAPSVRLSKGVHLVVDGGEGWTAAVTIPHDKVRVSFAIPWEGKLLLGTTDTLHEGEPEDGSRDRRRRAHDPRSRRAKPSATSARFGRRSGACACSPAGPGPTEQARRETVYTTGPTGMLSVAGGKLTTYRRIALDALEQLGVRNLDRAPRPLPGATGLAQIPWPAELDPATRAHLQHLYGSLAADVLAPALDDPSLLEPLVPGRPDLRAQELYAREHEWALHGGGCAATPHDRLARTGLDSEDVSEVPTADPAARS